MKDMQPPCKDCTDRYYKCHSECDKYKSYDDYRKEIRKKRKEECEYKDFAVSVASSLAKKCGQIEYNNRGK